MAWRKTTISHFLIPHEERYKANDPAIAEMPRIEKIYFSGNIVISQKPSKTDMIVIHPGDFVISGINVAKGAMAVYQGSEPVKATIHYSSYMVNKDVIELEYLKRFLKSPVFIQLLKEQVPGGIKTEIKPKHLLPLVIDLPQLSEQKAILERFYNTENEYCQLVGEIESQKVLLAKYRQAILQEAIQGKLTATWCKENPDVEPASELLKRIAAEKAELVKAKKIRKKKPLPPITENEIPFDIPETWEWCRLGNACYGFQYGTSSKSKKQGSVPVLRMGNIKNGTIEWDNLVYSSNSEEIDKFNLVTGDLLFNRTNSRELVGKPGLYKGNRQSIYAGYLVCFHMAGDIVPEYANTVMNSTLHADWCQEVKSDAIGQSNINATKLSLFRFPLPPLAEQREIVRRVEAQFAICDKLEAEITAAEQHAEQLSTAILQEVFDNHE